MTQVHHGDRYSSAITRRRNRITTLSVRGKTGSCFREERMIDLLIRPCNWIMPSGIPHIVLLKIDN